MKPPPGKVVLDANELPYRLWVLSTSQGRTCRAWQAQVLGKNLGEEAVFDVANAIWDSSEELRAVPITF